MSRFRYITFAYGMVINQAFNGAERSFCRHSHRPIIAGYYVYNSF